MTKCSCTIDDYDCGENQLYDNRFVEARVYQTCCECNETIRSGELHEYVKGKSNDNFWSYRTCMSCYEIRSCFFCSWIFGQLYYRLQEEIDDVELSGLESLGEEARNKFFERIEI